MANYLGLILDNRYEMLEVIGTGGMSVVYKARDVKLNRYVAVKILKDEILQEEELRNRFHTEAEAVAALSHPNIVSIFDVSLTKKTEYFVMELIDGITLKQYMQQRGVLSESELMHFITQILKALEHAHSRNIIHRDIKPQNVMILRDGTVKVTDFGIARMADRQQTVTQNALGSVHYIAPEQARGGITDGRTDLYSVGIIMYEMVTGELPFTGDTPVSIAIQHLSSEPPAPSSKNREVTPGLEAIIMKAMATKMEDRYSSATQMLADLETYKNNPLMPVGLYKNSEAPHDEEGETKLISNIKQDESGKIKVQNQPVKTEPRRQKTKYKYNERLPIVAGILSALVFMIVAVIVFLSLLKGCGTDTGEAIEMPDLVGKNYEDIVSELASEDEYQYLKIKVGEETYSDDKEAGIILSQDPKAGSLVKSNATITVDVSLGIKEISMIDVTNMDYGESSNKISTLILQNKLSDVTVKEVFEASESVEANIVIRTTPAVGEALKSGETITLYISAGSTINDVVMPNLYGDSLTEALKELQENKLSAGEIVEEFNDLDAGTVIGQSVAKGTVIKEGDTIDLIISKGPEEVDTTSETTTSETTSETTTDTSPKTGSASYTFPPSSLADTRGYEDTTTFSITIKANGLTVWHGENLTTGTSSITVTSNGTIGSSCYFAVFINNENTEYTFENTTYE